MSKLKKLMQEKPEWLPPIDTEPSPLDVSLWELFPRDLFIQMREEGYIRVQILDNSVLAIANYTEKAQYEQKWNAVTLACRGLIFDVFSSNVVARPFAKFFNWDDSSQAYPPKSECILMPKMDGSLGILYFHDDGYKIATRGSFTSDQAVWATKKIREIIADYEPIFHTEKTYLFEIIYPENQIVVDYKGKESLTLLDVIDNKSGTADLYEFQQVDVPDKVWRKHVLFDDTLIHDIPQGEEGFVMLWPHQNLRVKMKSAEYLEIHKMVFGLNARVVWERIGRGETWQDICDKLPDEFHQWVKNVSDSLAKQHVELVGEAHWQYREAKQSLPDGYTRKDFALKAQSYPMKSYLFMLEDGKDISETAWNAVKPSGVDKITIISEDVA